jgi:hypothetical protein
MFKNMNNSKSIGISSTLIIFSDSLLKFILKVKNKKSMSKSRKLRASGGSQEAVENGIAPPMSLQF